MKKLFLPLKTLDLKVLFGLLILTTVLLWFLPVNRMVGFALLYMPPTIWLIYRLRHPYNAVRAALVTTLLTLTVGYIYCVLSMINHFWGMPGMIELGIIPGSLDGLMWAWLYGFLMIVVYKSLLDRSCPARLNQKFLPTFTLMFMAAVAVMFIAGTKPELLNFNSPWSFALIGLIFTFPVYTLWLATQIIPKIITLALYAVPVSLVSELLAVKHGWWTYPGQYLFEFHVFGLESTLEQIIFFSLFGLSYAILYEFMVDDEK